MEKHVLRFVIGNETTSIQEDLFDIESDNFFNDVYRKALEIIVEIVENNNDATHHSDKFGKDADIRNNIVAFVGDRGVGKTSCMKTIYNVLPNINREIKNSELDKFRNVIEKENFLTLPIIDPTYFEEGHNILDIIISLMFDKFYQYEKRIDRFNFQDNNLSNKQDLIGKFIKVKKCLDVIKFKSNSHIDTFESLSELSMGINMKDALKDLVDSYLKYFSKSFLAIAIDDIDMQTRYAYNMIEEIRKYLIQYKVIILMSVKLSQLNDLIKQFYYKENKELIAINKFTDTTENLAGRYLSKLIPFNQRIYIPNITTRYSDEIQIRDRTNLTSDKNYVRGPIFEVILNLIYVKTGLLFYHEDTSPSLILPRNLRDLLNLISLLYKMPNDNITYNRLRLKNYFINTWCTDNLSSEMLLFIKGIEHLEVTNINKRVIYFLTHLNQSVSNENIQIDEAIQNINNRGYNVSLGDVCYVLNKVSMSCGIPLIDNFVFAIKTIYTFLLNEYLDINDIEKRSEILLFQYNESSINYKRLKKASRLMIISDYQKLLGGNVLRVARFDKLNFVKDGTKQQNKKQQEPNKHQKSHELNNDMLFMRRLNSQAWKDLNKGIFNCIYNNNDNSNNNVTLCKIKYDLKDVLKIWEFFVLNIYTNTTQSYFRKLKKCYYLSIPYSFPIETKAAAHTFSITSILFNIVKYYEYYELYKQIDQQKQMSNATNFQFYQFWKFLDGMKGESLIMNLLDESIFVKESFIRNMEVLDMLDDYLPNLNVQTSHDNKNQNFITEYTDFYSRLSQFQVPKYYGDMSKYLQGDDVNELKPFEKMSNVLIKFLNSLNENENENENENVKNIFLKIIYNKN